MASCTVCALPASVFCTQDTACLCASCDASIHSANPLSARHERRPLCDLCHRTPATVYCKEDAASLCPGCNEAVHEANPIKHTLTPAAALPCCSCQPNAQPNVLGNGGMEQPQPADSHSACGEKGGLAAHEAIADITQANSSPKTSCFGRVPEMLAVDATVAETAAQPAAPSDAKDALSGFLAKAPSLPKGFDFLELDTSASWLDRLDTGFDFADIFNTGPEEVPTDGLVPTLDNQGSDSAQRLLGDNFGQQVEQQSGAGVDQDLAVPTFSLSLPGELPVPELGHGLKRSAEAESADAAEVLMPSAKQQRMAAEQQQQAAAYTPLTAPVKPEMQSMPTGSMMAPAPFMWHSAPLAPPPPAVPQPPQPPQPQHQPAPTTYHSHTSSSQYAAHQAALAAGGNLTREQRVARYREKRKNRKFEKTIRYASRKAYAEVRPRIKGRFATKEEVIALKAQKQQQEQQQQQQMFQQQLEEDFVVPNFA